MTNIRSNHSQRHPVQAKPCSPRDNRRSGSSSSSTWTATATRRPCARSARRSASPRRPRCTRTSRTSSAPGCSGATRRSRARSSSSVTGGVRRRQHRRSSEMPRLPLLGADRRRVAAARGGERRGRHRRPRAARARAPTSCCTVTGDSMIEAGILDGDTLVVQQAARTRANGEIVVALVGDDESSRTRQR